MNLESLWIGHNLSRRCTAGKPGLMWLEKPPAAGCSTVGLTSDWLGPGPGLSVTGPCGAIPLRCTKFGMLDGGVSAIAPASLTGRFGLSALGLSSGRFGRGILALSSGRFGRSALGLLKGRVGLSCCALGLTA